MNRLLAAIALTFFFSFAFTSGASAQTERPPDRIGVVTGQLANGTANGETPGSLPMMLHAWDANGETVMLDGQADASGAFRFEDVPLQDGWVFAAMLTYKDVTFTSDPGEVTPETKELALSFTVYESTPDVSAVSVSQMHTLLDFAPGELAVVEVYVLSNESDRAVMGGVNLPAERGKTATLQFTLPPGANKVAFKGEGADGRFVITPDGFADTWPVLPGEGSSQIILSYTLPYSAGMTFARPIDLPVQQASVLVRENAGVALTGAGLTGPTQTALDTGEALNVYATGPFAPGDSLSVTFKGEPVIQSENGLEGRVGEAADSGLASLADRWALPIGGGTFGLALIVLGVWWWRRSAFDEKTDSELADSAESPDAAYALIRAIAEMDERHARSEISDEDYRTRRSELREQARGILQTKESGG